MAPVRALDVSFLSVVTVISVSRHVALRITHKGDAAEIIFEEERLGGSSEHLYQQPCAV